MPNPPTLKSLIQNVLYLLSLRSRSRGEIETYLNRKTADSTLVKQVMAYLDEHKLLDDYEFARAWSRSRIKRGKGDLIISNELQQKGIDKSVIQTVVQAIDSSDWLEAMNQVLDKYASKLNGLPTYQYQGKLRQILYQRGFSSRHIDAFMASRIE